MNDEQQSGVGFFRGLLAVLRGIAHAVGTLLSLFGRGLAAVTRRSRYKTGKGIGRSANPFRFRIGTLWTSGPAAAAPAVDVPEVAEQLT
jgi:hypothetical protein